MKSFSGHVVVVTGAASGMGRAYAYEVAARGAAGIAIADVDADGLAETEAGIGPGPTVLTRVVDVSSADQVREFAGAVERTLGPASVVINNAGIEGPTKPFWALTDADFDRIMAVNFGGVLHGSRAFLPQLIRHEKAALVNVSSVFGLTASPNQTDYSASKFAVRGFSEGIAIELAGTGVSVHVVHPGGVNTNISRSEASRAFAEKYLGTTPQALVRTVLDQVGTRHTRIVAGHRSGPIKLGVRMLPLWLMNRFVARDVADVLDRSFYPPSQATIAASPVGYPTGS